MTSETRRKATLRARAPRRTPAEHASGAHEFSDRFVKPSPARFAPP